MGIDYSCTNNWNVVTTTLHFDGWIKNAYCKPTYEKLWLKYQAFLKEGFHRYRCS